MQNENLAVIIREVVVDDAKAIIALYQQVKQETSYLVIESDSYLAPETQAKLIESYVTHDQALMLVVEIEGQIVALANLAPVAEAVSEIGVCVIQAYWGYGIGTMLLEELIAYARQVATKILTIEVMNENVRAIHLYEKLGFRVIKQRESLLPKQLDDATTQLMVYDLS